MKRKAKITEETVQQILGEQLGNISENAAANLPSIATMRRNIRKAQEDGNIPQILLNREVIPVLPNENQMTKSGEPFLMFDSGEGDSERMFTFASEIDIHFLLESEHWFSDGTFGVCSGVFFQVYTGHAQQCENFFSCIFSLLSNKTEATYIRFYCDVFNRVCRQGKNLDDILVDFERATINAIHHLNQHIEIKSCFYHLFSNIWKRIQESGLQRRYNKDKEFALGLKMLSAIAFLPPNDVI